MSGAALANSLVHFTIHTSLGKGPLDFSCSTNQNFNRTAPDSSFSSLSLASSASLCTDRSLAAIRRRLASSVLRIRSNFSSRCLIRDRKRSIASHSSWVYPSTPVRKLKTINMVHKSPRAATYIDYIDCTGWPICFGKDLC